MSAEEIPEVRAVLEEMLTIYDGFSTCIYCRNRFAFRTAARHGCKPIAPHKCEDCRKKGLRP